MLNIYQVEKRLQKELHERSSSIKEHKRLEKARSERESLAQGYKQRVALFIKDMICDPIIENDKYTLKQEDYMKTQEFKLSLLISFKKNQQNDLKPASFRFCDTQDDRMKKSQQEHSILDSVPNQNINQTFAKLLRRRERQKEIQSDVRFKHKNSVERIYDNLRSRDSCYLRSSDITDTQSFYSSRQQFYRQLSSDHSRSEGFKMSVNSKSFSTEQNYIQPKNILPAFHRKTHFKAATSLYMREPGSLNIEDGLVDSILQDIKSISGARRYYLLKRRKEENSKSRSFHLNSLSQTFNHNKQYETSSHNKFKNAAANFIDICDQSLQDQKIVKVTPKQASQQVVDDHRIDYNEVTYLTKQILKNCNVVRRKNLNLIRNSKVLTMELDKIKRESSFE